METTKIFETRHGPAYDMSALGFQRGDVVVVTGAGSGIGQSCAIFCARAGLHVHAWDLDANSLESTQHEIATSGGTVTASRVDVTDAASVESAWSAAAGSGRCAYLVNNAGPASTSSGSFDDNMKFAVGSMQTVTSLWLARHGEAARSVVNMSSVAGNVHGLEDVQPFYPAAKAAIAGYTRHLAVRYGGQPRANAVAPGFIVTPRTVPYLALPGVRRMIDRVPMQRPGYPEDIAAAVCFLLSPAAAFINGVLLPVDGGLIHAS